MRWWLFAYTCLIASGCVNVLGVDDFQITDEKDRACGTHATCDLCRNAKDKNLVCGDSPYNAQLTCGSCSDETSCAGDQLACLPANANYCGQGVICKETETCYEPEGSRGPKCCDGTLATPILSDGTESSYPPYCCSADSVPVIFNDHEPGCCLLSEPYPCAKKLGCCDSPS